MIVSNYTKLTILFYPILINLKNNNILASNSTLYSNFTQISTFFFLSRKVLTTFFNNNSLLCPESGTTLPENQGNAYFRYQNDASQ